MDRVQAEQVISSLKEIENHTDAKPSYYVTVTGKRNVIKTDFSPPLNFEGCRYQIACCGVELYYSFPNITEENNKLKISKDGKIWRQLKLDIGCYEIEAINTTLKRLIKDAGEEPKNFCLSPNKNTFQSVINITNMKVDFRGDTGSLRKVLGFDEKLYETKEVDKQERFASEHVVNILRVNSIFLHCDVVKLSRRNGKTAPIIYTFFPRVTPGSKIVDRPRNLIYLPLTLDIISHMSCWLTDQNGNALETGDEEITITFHIKAC